MKKILIGLLVLGSISAFAGKNQLKVFHCKGRYGSNCKEVTNRSLGKKVAKKLSQAEYSVSPTDTLEITLYEGCRPFIDACQEWSYGKAAIAEIKDENGNVLRSESVEKSARLFGSSRSLLAELIEKL